LAVRGVPVPRGTGRQREGEKNVGTVRLFRHYVRVPMLVLMLVEAVVAPTRVSFRTSVMSRPAWGHCLRVLRRIPW